MAHQGQRYSESESQRCPPPNTHTHTILQAGVSGISQKACWPSQDKCFFSPEQAPCQCQLSAMKRLKGKPPGQMNIRAAKEQVG